MNLTILFLLAKQFVWRVGLVLFEIINLFLQRAILKAPAETENTACVYSIWARHKFDKLVSHFDKSNFLTTLQRYVQPEYVLQENVTLYSINEREAIFVEVRKGLDVSKVEVDAFVKLAQFENALKLITVPLADFHMLGESIGKPEAPMVFVIGTARCGSTLLQQVLEETNQCFTIGLPYIVPSLRIIKPKITQQEYEKLLKNAINLLCKPKSNSREPKAYILKSVINNISLIPDIKQHFPESMFLFMYRDGLPTAQSIAKIFKQMPQSQIEFFLYQVLAGDRQLNFLQGAEYCKTNRIQSHMHKGAIKWASTVQKYNQAVKGGTKMMAIRFEDLLQDTDYAFREVFRHLQLPYDRDVIDRALATDSQRSSILSRKSLAKYEVKEVTPEIQKQMDHVCDFYDLPRFPEVYILPNTITHRPKIVM